MAVDERARHQLFTKLEEKLGRDAAETLMGLLPPVGWADVATKRDLDALGTELRGEIRGATATLKSELLEAMAELQGRMTLQMIAINGGSMLAVAGIAFAAARLL